MKKNPLDSIFDRLESIPIREIDNDTWHGLTLEKKDGTLSQPISLKNYKKTNVMMDQRLFANIKHYCSENDCSIREFMEEAAKLYLKKNKKRRT